MTAAEPLPDAQRGRREPNFFVVGASRAGTTSLWHYLKQHPDVYLPADPLSKEPSHFCDLTPVWARKYRDFDAYLGLFDKVVDERAIGDASTTYLPSPESAGRIRERYPDAKIIIMLRNPADRAYSLYSLLCQLGFEWITPFERALTHEEARCQSEEFKHDNPFWFYAYQYFRSGLYAEQVERYLTAFSAERVKIIRFEAFRKWPVEITQDVYGFIGVDPAFRPTIAVHNRGSFPFSVRLQRAIVRRWTTHPLKGAECKPSLLGRGLRRAAKGNLLLGRLRPRRFNPSTRQDLLRRYEQDIRSTGALIGRDLDAWIRGDEVADA
jgi:hypothetical protein